MALTKTQQELINLLSTSLPSLKDEDAIKFTQWYPMWKEGIEITQDMINEGKNRFQYKDILYRTDKPHTTQSNWAPGIETASLWTAINVTNAGTKEDPIILPDELVSFEYEWGKYYKEGEDLYLCNRQGGKDGDKYTLVYKPSQLIGHYFEKIVE